MLHFFKNKTGLELNKLSQNIGKKINSNKNLVRLIDQVGILDGSKIISEYVDQKEFSLAYTHLIYMINESGINLMNSEVFQLNKLSKKLKLPLFDNRLPTLIELNNFYDSIKLFNQRQKEVVSILSEKWKVKTPITNLSWIDWRIKNNNESNHQKDEYRIFAHGYGLNFYSPNFTIDFDFGAEGQHNGFDLYRLWNFVDREMKDSIFTSEKHFKKVFDYEKENDKFIYDGYTLYYLKNL